MRGSSHGGTRIFRYAYGDPFYVELVARARDGWRRLEADAGVPLLDVTGSVDHAPDATVDALVSAMGAVGIAHEVLEPGEAMARFPGFRFTDRVVFHPDAGRTRASATVAALHGLVDVRYGARVESVTGVDADVVVVAAGAWTAKPLPDIGLPPVRVTREQVLHFEPVTGSETDWPSFIDWHEPLMYGLPTPGEGFKIGEHHSGPVVDPDTRTFVHDDGVERVIDHVRRAMPGLRPTPVHPATCLYTTTPTEDFVLDRVTVDAGGRSTDVVVVSACSGHGFKFAPEIGRLAADLALGAEPVHERFTLAAHGRTTDHVGHR